MWRPSCQAMWAMTFRHHATSRGETWLGAVQRGSHTFDRKVVLTEATVHVPDTLDAVCGTQAVESRTQARASSSQWPEPFLTICR